MEETSDEVTDSFAPLDQYTEKVKQEFKNYLNNNDPWTDPHSAVIGSFNNTHAIIHGGEDALNTAVDRGGSESSRQYVYGTVAHHVTPGIPSSSSTRKRGMSFFTERFGNTRKPAQKVGPQVSLSIKLFSMNMHAQFFSVYPVFKGHAHIFA